MGLVERSSEGWKRQEGRKHATLGITEKIWCYNFSADSTKALGDVLLEETFFLITFLQRTIVRRTLVYNFEWNFREFKSNSKKKTFNVCFLEYPSKNLTAVMPNVTWNCTTKIHDSVGKKYVFSHNLFLFCSVLKKIINLVFILILLWPQSFWFIICACYKISFNWDGCRKINVTICNTVVYKRKRFANCLKFLDYPAINLTLALYLEIVRWKLKYTRLHLYKKWCYFTIIIGY
jgi:hypothetical protein